MLSEQTERSVRLLFSAESKIFISASPTVRHDHGALCEIMSGKWETWPGTKRRQVFKLSNA